VREQPAGAAALAAALLLMQLPQTLLAQQRREAVQISKPRASGIAVGGAAAGGLRASRVGPGAAAAATAVQEPVVVAVRVRHKLLERDREQIRGHATCVCGDGDVVSVGSARRERYVAALDAGKLL
jgi:hypothetical protein